MCRISEPQQRNVVFLFRVGPEQRKVLQPPPGALYGETPAYLQEFACCSERSRRRRGRQSNFYVFKLVPFSYTVFPSSGNVIATGIRSDELIPRAIRTFSDATGISRRKVGLGGRIVNSTHVGEIECGELPRISACRVLARFKAEASDAEMECVASISFRSQFFPGARIRWSCGGTTNLFNNGKYVQVGVRNRVHARRLHAQLCAIMASYWTTSGVATSCAWSAG